MHPLVRRGLLGPALASLSMLTACATDVAPDASDVSEDELRKGSAEQWIYNGPLPRLENPSVTVSLTAHTVRVSGYLPRGYGKPLPYYVDTLADGDRTKIAVVYPIATGISVNSQGSRYNIESVAPWVPTNSKATWGGFPFIPYNGGIAFHGPITASDGEWKLIRGAVSHGCNRMQGEHVVEFANLIGVDMTSRVHSGNSKTVDVPVTVLRKADTWKGQAVDVDYPARPEVQRPRGNVKMFPSWSADDFAAFVCPLNKRELGGSSVVPAGYCARKYANRADPVRGPGG